MFYKIKKSIDKEIKKFIEDIDKNHYLSKASPVLFNAIKDFITRKGKRIRPILFVVGYLGFAKRKAPNLYTSALSIELLHDFMLVHDDIIDKSDLRRGKPTMHKMFEKYLDKHKDIRFSGKDLAIVIGDVMYALAVHTFLSIKEDMQRKEKALRRFIESAIYTGCGEFIEILSGIDGIEKIKKQDIYKIYDYKTAYYTFAYPLSTGALLAGATPSQTDKLFQYGICMGRAFQMKDDILDMFSDEQSMGKSPLTDLKEAKKTLLIWYAYRNTGDKNRSLIKRVLTKKNIRKADLLKMRGIISSSGALHDVRKEMIYLTNKARRIITSSRMKASYKKVLQNYPRELFKI